LLFYEQPIHKMKVKIIIPSDKELLKQQIELEESNFKYALELQKDPALLWKMKDHIKELKDKLHQLEDTE
jgi:hypothetical protein